MLVGDKKGMRVPSETRLGESYPLRSEQKSSSQQQRPVTNNKSTLGRADPASAERGTVPPGRQQGSRRHAKHSSRSKSLVFAAQAPVKQQAVYLGYEVNAFLQGEATGSTELVLPAVVLVALLFGEPAGRRELGPSGLKLEGLPRSLVLLCSHKKCEPPGSPCSCSFCSACLFNCLCSNGSSTRTLRVHHCLETLIRPPFRGPERLHHPSLPTFQLLVKV